MADLNVPNVLMGVIPTVVKKKGRPFGAKNKPKEEAGRAGATAAKAPEKAPEKTYEYSDEELDKLTAPVVASKVPVVEDIEYDSQPERSEDVAESRTPQPIIFSPDAIDLQVISLPKFELECLVKRYYKALLAIADVECKEDGKWCHENRSIECEHNHARNVLEI